MPNELPSRNFATGRARFWRNVLLIALASILYASTMAFTTTDARLILGYSSVAQMGFIVLGIFALNNQGAQGAVLQSVNHGLLSATLFLLALCVGFADRGVAGPTPVCGPPQAPAQTTTQTRSARARN